MSNFLCGMIGNMRIKREKLINSVLSDFSKKTNNDVSSITKKYIKGGKTRKKHGGIKFTPKIKNKIII